MEAAAFYSDHDFFHAGRRNECFRGYLTKEVTVPEGIILFGAWELREGAFFNAAYNPYAKYRFIEGAADEGAGTIASKFVNERIYYGNNS